MLRNCPTGEDVLTFLCQEPSNELLTQANFHVEHITALVDLYVRGVGMPKPEHPATMAAGLRQVIVGAAARTLGNPDTTARLQVGNYSKVRAQFTGWTLPELAVLHHFLKRTA